MLAIGEDLVGDAQTAILDFARPNTALYVGGMGARGKNFYNDIAQRYGYEEEAIDDAGPLPRRRKDEAAAAVPRRDAREHQPGRSRSYVKERIAAYKEAGVTTLLGQRPSAATRCRRSRPSASSSTDRVRGGSPAVSGLCPRTPSPLCAVCSRLALARSAASLRSAAAQHEGAAAGGDEHVGDVGHLVGGGAAHLAHRFDDVVDPVDVGLAEQAAVGVDRERAVELDVAVGDEVLRLAAAAEARTPRAAGRRRG